MGFCPHEERPVAAGPEAGAAGDLTTSHFH